MLKLQEFINIIYQMNQFESLSFPNIYNKNFHFYDNESISDGDESI
jgi:hypothetical protein